MSVRKREWITRKGEPKEAWIVDYVDQKGKRHIKTFEKKKQADACQASVRVDVSKGVHVADSESVTVEKAGELWIKTAEKNRLEQTTVDQYRQHLDQHIVPFLGRIKLSQVSPPTVRDFEDKLGRGPDARSPAMVKKVIGSLGAILADAQERGLVARNVVRDLRSNRRRGKERRAERRHRGKLKVGADIPLPAEIKAIVEHADNRWRPLLRTAAFTGLRASELRGLRWSDLDFKKAVLHVHQRADRYNTVGAPKSEAGERKVPIAPGLLTALREWKLACPKSPLDLVFPNGIGKIESHANIINRGLIQAQIAGGVSYVEKDADGKVITDDDGEPVRKAKYTGMHALRHFYASWCINRKTDGGLELPAKMVQDRLGHSSITVTLDTYGHLFPSGDDGAELAAAEGALMGGDAT